MTITYNTFRFIAQNGHILRISQILEKYSQTFVWRVCASYDGVTFYVLKDGLKNKPNKRQIEKYLEQI